MPGGRGLCMRSHSQSVAELGGDCSILVFHNMLPPDVPADKEDSRDNLRVLESLAFLILKVVKHRASRNWFYLVWNQPYRK